MCPLLQVHILLGHFPLPAYIDSMMQEIFIPMEAHALNRAQINDEEMWKVTLKEAKVTEAVTHGTIHVIADYLYPPYDPLIQPKNLHHGLALSRKARPLVAEQLQIGVTLRATMEEVPLSDTMEIEKNDENECFAQMSARQRGKVECPPMPRCADSKKITQDLFSLEKFIIDSEKNMAGWTE